MSNKTKYVTRAQEMASIFSALTDDIIALQSVWFDRGYNTSGADEMTSQDLDGMTVTVADVTGMVTFAAALDTFLTANRGYLSKMRNDL